MIHYLEGDATLADGCGGEPGKRIIAHVCNDKGGWGSGFVVALARRYPLPKSQYIMWAQGKKVTGEPEEKPFALGEVTLIQAEWGKPDLLVANMIAQTHIRKRPDGSPPIDYKALNECLHQVFQFAGMHGYSVHMPRIGCGLAGGKWDAVEPLIEFQAAQHVVKTFVYDWTGGGPEQIDWQR